jgi:L-asparaginase
MSTVSDYRLIDLKHVTRTVPKASVLIIYTGGTVGMVHDDEGALIALDFNQIIDRVPTLGILDINLSVISFPEPFDSSNVSIAEWQNIAGIIYDFYDKFDGFVVLHGTDTMAYTASALSFMLKNLNKPVIFTGAQLPVSAVRTDARANLVTALEIAAARRNGRPVVPEVCIYFDYQLMRGNRTFKKRSNQFAAFGCENYPILARVGISINYNDAVILPYRDDLKIELCARMSSYVFVLKLFPSLEEAYLRHVVNIPGLRGLIIESYGAGNAPTADWFLRCLREAVNKGIIVYNVSQIIGGMVTHGRYETSKYFDDIGIVSGGDITREAALTKMMFLLGNEEDPDTIRRKLSTPICGELTI